MTSARNWSCEDVGLWLEDNGFVQYRSLFSDQHKIDGHALLTLVEADLRQPPLQITVLGDIKRLMICITKLQQENKSDLKRSGLQNGATLRVPQHLIVQSQRRNVQRLESVSSLSDIDDETAETDLSLNSTQNVSNGRFSECLDPEMWKTALSFVYVFLVFLLTAVVMVIVHDRVPDMEKYPPLPDIFLDNIPYIPWAFLVSELIGLLLLCLWGVILFFHKHRFILMRRMFSMTGTVFLLRCVCMLITSLSVPGVHLQCSGKIYGSYSVKLQRALEIWSGFGMTLKGVRTCGDYMFSGHTVCITMLNFFITEYTPRRRMYFLHTLAWVLNLFGIFFIVAAHEHYSIDVFIAFYISSRLFLYYHTLANNRSLMLNDKKRTRIWFPMFSFFESKIDGVIPNEFEWPFPWPKSFVKYFYVCKKKKQQ